MSLDAWIDDLGRELAGAHPRRRPPLAALAAVAVVLAVVALVALRDAPAEREVPAATLTAVPEVAPEAILRRIYMGVSCPQPNRIECDRVGILADLQEDARSVVAEVGGRRVALDDPGWGGASRHTFAGFLQPAGLRGDGPLAVQPEPDGRWIGRPPVEARVSFTITRLDGTQVRTSDTIPLRAGWG